IDLVGGTTRNLATKLADFGRYLALIPDLQGATTFRLTFHNYAGATLGTASSAASTVTPGGGFSAGGGVCSVTVSPTSLGAPGAGGSVTLNINGGACGWTATSNAPWLTPTASSGSSATLVVNVAANTTGAQRSGTISIGGQA